MHAVNMTSYEKGFEIGFEIGRREFVRELIEERFGSLLAEVVQRLEQVPAEQLDTLRKAISKAGSLRDLGLDA
jgi:flagellar biosynthesis/type III secretory pathway protein FliH